MDQRHSDLLTEKAYLQQLVETDGFEFFLRKVNDEYSRATAEAIREVPKGSREFWAGKAHAFGTTTGLVAALIRRIDSDIERIEEEL